MAAIELYMLKTVENWLFSSANHGTSCTKSTADHVACICNIGNMYTHTYIIYIYINIKNSDKSSYKISWVLFGPQNAAPWPHRRQNLWLSHPAARNRPQRRETPSTCRADLVHSSPWMVSYYLIVVHPYFLQHPSEFRYHMISLMIATRQQTQTKQTMGSCKLSQQARKSGLF